MVLLLSVILLEDPAIVFHLHGSSATDVADFLDIMATDDRIAQYSRERADINHIVPFDQGVCLLHELGVHRFKTITISNDNTGAP